MTGTRGAMSQEDKEKIAQGKPLAALDLRCIARISFPAGDSKSSGRPARLP